MSQRLLTVGEATVYSLHIANELNQRMPYDDFDIYQHDVAEAIATGRASCAARTAVFGARASNDGINTFFVRPDDESRSRNTPPHASGFIEVDDPLFLGVGVDSFNDPRVRTTEAAFVYFVQRPPKLKGLSLATLMCDPESVVTIPTPGGTATLEVRHFAAGHEDYQNTVGSATFTTAEEVCALVDAVPRLQV